MENLNNLPKESLISHVGELKTAYSNSPWMYIVLFVVGIFGGNTDRITSYVNSPSQTSESQDFTELTNRVNELQEAVYINNENVGNIIKYLEESSDLEPTKNVEAEEEKPQLEAAKPPQKIKVNQK